MKKKTLETMVALALAAMYTPAALAQETPSTASGEPAVAAPPAATPAAAPAQDKVETVVVTGFRSSLQKALNLKAQAIGVRDSIVAEDIGKFPEANVAESLQRVPGVILNRDESSGEGQRISIRGLPTDYSVTTLNGAPVNTTSTSTIGSAARGFNYDVFASELFGQRRLLQIAAGRADRGRPRWRRRSADPAPVRQPEAHHPLRPDRHLQHRVQAQ